MSEECPFCGQELWGEQSDYHPIRIWKCKTIGFSEGFNRSNQCYEAELISKDKWRREATELFNKWLYLEKKGLLTCAFSPKTLAGETNAFLNMMEIKP